MHRKRVAAFVTQITLRKRAVLLAGQLCNTALFSLNETLGFAQSNSVRGELRFGDFTIVIDRGG
jgi:hypothetical protein